MTIHKDQIQLAAVILTANEAYHIQECIESLRDWVETIIVWDSMSSDETCALARQAGAHVIRRPFDNFSAQRQAVLDTINAKWILFIDADERLTTELAKEIHHKLQPTADTPLPSPNGYWIPRRNFIVGHETRGGGFYPDYQLRLICRENARYNTEREVHEIVEISGTEGYLGAPLIHHNYLNWSQFHYKQHFYAAYEARILAARGIQPRPHNFVLQPIREFRRRYITLQGWKDGLHGLRLASLLAWYYGFMPYWILWRDESVE